MATTKTVPLPGGAVAAHVVLLVHDTLVARRPPNWNWVDPGVTSKPVPVMVTTVAGGPMDGEIERSEGM